MAEEQIPILEITQEFFTAPLWIDTIKDFVLANCYIFTGEEEFCLEHFNCHKQFCKIIENTLNIYLLDILGITFEDFEKACLDAASLPNSIAANVIGILKQATDFKYFAAKMYAYNLMLDQQVHFSFKVEGNANDESAFFITEGANIENEYIVAASNLHDVEKQLGVPPSNPAEIIEPVVKSEPTPSAKKPVTLPPIEAKPQKPAQPIPEPKVMGSTQIPNISEAERAAMKKKIEQERKKMATTIDAEELQRRKDAFQKRKQQLVDQKRTECKEQIDLDLQKHERPVPAQEEDPLEAIRRALAGRVKTMIDES